VPHNGGFGQIAMVVPGPYVCEGRRSINLSSSADPVVGSPRAPVKDVSNAQFVANLPKINRVTRCEKLELRSMTSNSRNNGARTRRRCAPVWKAFGVTLGGTREKPVSVLNRYECLGTRSRLKSSRCEVYRSRGRSDAGATSLALPCECGVCASRRPLCGDGAAIAATHGESNAQASAWMGAAGARDFNVHCSRRARGRASAYRSSAPQ